MNSKEKAVIDAARALKSAFHVWGNSQTEIPDEVVIQLPQSFISGCNSVAAGMGELNKALNALNAETGEEGPVKQVRQDLRSRLIRKEAEAQGTRPRGELWNEVLCEFAKEGAVEPATNPPMSENWVGPFSESFVRRLTDLPWVRAGRLSVKPMEGESLAEWCVEIVRQAYDSAEPGEGLPIQWTQNGQSYHAVLGNNLMPVWLECTDSGQWELCGNLDEYVGEIGCSAEEAQVAASDKLRELFPAFTNAPGEEGSPDLQSALNDLAKHHDMEQEIKRIQRELEKLKNTAPANAALTVEDLEWEGKGNSFSCVWGLWKIDFCPEFGCQIVCRGVTVSTFPCRPDKAKQAAVDKLNKILERE